MSISMMTGIPHLDAYEPGTFPLWGVEEKADGVVRIASFNIRCGDVAGEDVKRRVGLVIQMINDMQADSVGVQEATEEWMLHLRSLLPDYTAVGGGRDGKDKGEHCAILYQTKRYRLVDSGTFWLSETPEEVSYGWDAACRRVCTWAVLENRETQERYVHVNTHLDHRGVEARPKGAQKIADFIKANFADLPVVFTADMNSNENSEAYAAMMTALRDTNYAAPDTMSYGTFHNTKPNDSPKAVIDYVLCSASVTPLSYRVVTKGINDRYVSDHFPVYADVKIG